MSFIDPKTKEVNCKIVYYGPAFSGKSANIKSVYQKMSKGRKGQVLSVPQSQDKTIFFDFIPLSIGTVNDFKIRFHLYTVPGQPLYETSRRIILKGVDGIVFVADSQVAKIEDNLASLKSLETNLIDLGSSLNGFPLVMQYNKRDVKGVAPVSELNSLLNEGKVPSFEAVADKGKGVMETMQTIAKLVLKDLRD
jgi:mutual gliding-motility protein MglA